MEFVLHRQKIALTAQNWPKDKLVAINNMHGIISQLFDCWAYPVAHLLIIKSSMAKRYFLVFAMHQEAA